VIREVRDQYVNTRQPPARRPWRSGDCSGRTHSSRSRPSR
jgi:hypothetical protein